MSGCHQAVGDDVEISGSVDGVERLGASAAIFDKERKGDRSGGKILAVDVQISLVGGDEAYEVPGGGGVGETAGAAEGSTAVRRAPARREHHSPCDQDGGRAGAGRGE